MQKNSNFIEDESIYKKTNKISSSPVKSFVGLRLFIDGGRKYKKYNKKIMSNLRL
jgi:hypothetical protein